MRKIILIICLILFVNYINKVKAEKVVIPKDSIRLRILANSNSKYDQKIKIKLGIKIQNKLQELLKDTKNINQADIIIKQNIDYLNRYINEELHNMNYDKKATILYGNNFFPNKQYKDVIYEKGYYQSILVKIGKGDGKNWWCVLFPPLCMVDSNNNEYKYFVREIIDKYL